ncbi:MAG: DUF6259 domain-containing protein [Kiritimatiellia bacterium]|jgi:hypothetical protein
MTRQAVFSTRHGALESFQDADGVELVRPAAEAFTLSFLDAQGDEIRMKSSEFAFAKEGDDFVYRKPEGPTVRIAVREADGALRFKPSVRDWPTGLRLNWFDGPQIHVSTRGRLFWPFCDGVEVSRFDTKTDRSDGFTPLGWAKRVSGLGSLYPAEAQMQFIAHYQDGRGVYFAALDDRHVQKAVNWELMDADTLRLTLQTFCGEAEDGVYKSGFEYELRPFRGGWMEACELYRDWIRTLPAFAGKPDYPDWFEDSPITMIYPVKGEGLDHGPEPLFPNRYYPYTNVLAEVEKYSDALDSRLMALVMHWEGTAPWCPPYVWPPFGGEAALAALRDALHAQGHLLGLYCSGTAWTQVSCTDFQYSQEQKFVDEDLGRFMMRGPKGEIEGVICNHPRGQRIGYDMCLAEDWCRRTLIDEALKMARFGIDYCQFFDQNLGGGARLCWSAKHDHPPVPGAWMSDAMRTLQEDMLAEIAAVGSTMTLGCEACAATPFVKTLFFNDSRPGFSRHLGRKVPAMGFVFHEWMCNFSGNQCGQATDPFYRWTWSFLAGDMLSIVLGPDGKLIRSWGTPWTAPVPDQEKLIGLVRRFNDLRKQYPRHLLRGRMIRPFVQVVSAESRIDGGMEWEIEPEVMSSFWEAEDGSRVGFLSNRMQHDAAVELIYPDGRTETRRLAALETDVMEME